MVRLQVCYYREVDTKRGQEMLAQMAAQLKDQPPPVDGAGRLHVPGVTLGENPWPLVIQQCLVANRFELDDLNWIYWRPYDLRSEAEIMLRDLENMREQCRTHADPAVRECVEGGHMHFRMLLAHPAAEELECL